MNKFNDLLPLILENKLTQAKDVLNERLYAKLGQRLEESLEEYAPTVFMTKEELEIYEEKKKKKLDVDDEDEDGDIDEDGDSDESDEYLKNRSEAIKTAMDTQKEEVELDDDDTIEEDFLNELTAIVEEIETELGEELTEEEIAEIAEELLSEEEKEDDMEDEEDSEDEEESEDMEETCESCGKKHKKYKK